MTEKFESKMIFFFYLKCMSFLFPALNLEISSHFLSILTSQIILST